MLRDASSTAPLTKPREGPERAVKSPLAATHVLLTEGGDQRIRLDPATGLNKYGCPPTPTPHLAAFGSSTASAISTPALEAARRLRDRLIPVLRDANPSDVYEAEAARLRKELVSLCGLEGQAGLETAIAASGTDIHMLIAQLLAEDADHPIRVIMGEASETGRGVPAALSGRHYGSCAPFEAQTEPGASIAEGMEPEIIHVASRSGSGDLRDAAEVDAEVDALSAEAVGEGRRVLIVVTDASKTGLISPSPGCALALERRFKGRLDVLVDACQLRLSPETLNAYAERGWMIAVTGSKFLTGPAFSGAIFIPSAIAKRLRGKKLSPRIGAFSARGDWPEGWAIRQGLDPHPNFGLLLRWEAALEELQRFRKIPEAEVARFLSRFASVARAGMAHGSALQPLQGRRLERDVGPEEGWDHLPSIFAFTLRAKTEDGGERSLSPDETNRVYDLMRQDFGLVARDAGDPRLEAAAALKVELGQPVSCGVRDGAPLTALRLCASARLIAEAGADRRRADEILSEAALALAKAAWLAQEVADGRL
jgi:hypothetical protein